MDDHENPLGIEPYVLPDDLIREARDISSTLSRSIEEISGTFLVHRQVTAITFQDGPKTVELSASEIARFLGQLRHLTLDSATPTPRHTPEIKFIGVVGANILRFIEIFFEDLRGIICKRAKSLSGTTHTVIVALASWFAGKRRTTYDDGGRNSNPCCRPHGYQGRVLQDVYQRSQSLSGGCCSANSQDGATRLSR